MDYSMFLSSGLASAAYSPRGSSEVDRLDDRMLADIGLKRVNGRVVKDEPPFQEVADRGRAGNWVAFWSKHFANLFAHPHRTSSATS